jgi:hypothetical protein
VATIPRSCKTIQDATIWADADLRLPHIEGLAAIAVRDSSVVLSVSHMGFDGQSFVLLMNRYIRGTFVEPSRFPLSIDDCLKQELSATLDASEHTNARTKLATVPWSGTPVRGYRDNSRADFILADLAPQSLQCFDAKKGQFHGLTDALWRSGVLAAHAMNPNQKGWGCATWVNVRPYVNRWAVGNYAAPMSMVADGMTGEATLADLELKLRRDYNDKRKRRYVLKGLKAFIDALPVPRVSGAFFDISNVGYFPTTGPFIDTWGQMTLLARSSNSGIGMSALTVYGNDKARLTLRFPYSQLVFTRSDAVRTFRAVCHSLQHLKPNMKIKDAIRELQAAADAK